MKGLILRGLALVGCTVVLTSASGCLHPRNLWDPCWPQRYNFLARQEVLEGLGEQVHNGHVLDQTVWNWHFEPGTDKLTVGAQEHLKYLARRRPCPDQHVFLQTAQDVTYNPETPEKFAMDRSELNAKRIAAVQKFLTTYTAGCPVAFDVVVHDPADVGMQTIPMGLAVQRMYAGSQGVLPSSGGAGAGNVSGGSGSSR